ncbi:hypothetical protein Tco_0779942, partial [Tanacetum coccineum]
MFLTRRAMKCLVLRPGKRKAEEGCCVMSKAMEGGRGKRVLAVTAENGSALFLEPQSTADIPVVVAGMTVFALPLNSESGIAGFPSSYRGALLNMFRTMGAAADLVLYHEERISKKRTKNEVKTTKSDTEWKSVEKTKSRQSPSVL